MNRINVIIVSGLPGSGKDTFVQSVLKRRSCLVLDKDLIRHMMYGKYEYKESDEDMVERIYFAALKEFVKDGRDIILNSTHLTTEKRLNALGGVWDAIKSSGRVVYAKPWVCQINTPVATCIERRERENRGFEKGRWERVILEMAKVFEPISWGDEVAFSVIDPVYGWCLTNDMVVCKCPVCKKEVERDAKFCLHCHKSFVE